MAESNQKDFSRRALMLKEESNQANSLHHTHLINEHDAANKLGLKVATLRRWRWEGRRLPFYKIGHAVRYDPVEIEKFIEVSRRTSTSDVGDTV